MIEAAQKECDGNFSRYVSMLHKERIRTNTLSKDEFKDVIREVIKEESKNS